MTSLLRISTILLNRTYFTSSPIRMNSYEWPTPNPAPKPTCHCGLDKSYKIEWVRSYKFVRISHLVKYIRIVHEIALVLPYSHVFFSISCMSAMFLKHLIKQKVVTLFKNLSLDLAGQWDFKKNCILRFSISFSIFFCINLLDGCIWPLSLHPAFQYFKKHDAQVKSSSAFLNRVSRPCIFLNLHNSAHPVRADIICHQRVHYTIERARMKAIIM